MFFLSTATPLAAGSLLFHNAQDISSSGQVLTAENRQLLSTLVLSCWLYFTNVLGSISNLEKTEGKLLAEESERPWRRVRHCAWSHGSYPGSCGRELVLQVAGSVFSLLNIWSQPIKLSKAWQKEHCRYFVETNESCIMQLGTYLVSSLSRVELSWSCGKVLGEEICGASVVVSVCEWARAAEIRTSWEGLDWASLAQVLSVIGLLCINSCRLFVFMLGLGLVLNLTLVGFVLSSSFNHTEWLSFVIYVLHRFFMLSKAFVMFSLVSAVHVGWWQRRKDGECFINTRTPLPCPWNYSFFFLNWNLTILSATLSSLVLMSHIAMPISVTHTTFSFNHRFPGPWYSQNAAVLQRRSGVHGTRWASNQDKNSKSKLCNIWTCYIFCTEQS